MTSASPVETPVRVPQSVEPPPDAEHRPRHRRGAGAGGRPPDSRPGRQTCPGSAAGSTGGTAYTAASGDQLQHAYDDLGKQVGTKTARRDQTAAVTGLALLLALGAAGASLVWFRVLP